MDLANLTDPELVHQNLCRLAKTRSEMDYEIGCWLVAAHRLSIHEALGHASFEAYVEWLFGFSRRKSSEHLRVALLNTAKFIYCRDSRTLQTLKDAGVKPPVLEWGPDGCFGIDVRDEEKALARMKKHGLEEKKFITMQLRTHSPSSPGVDDKRPQKLNPLHPTPENIADDTRRAKVYQDLIAMWVKKTGWKAVIAPEVYKEMEYNKKFVYDPLPDGLKNANPRKIWRIVNGEYTKAAVG